VLPYILPVAIRHLHDVRSPIHSHISIANELQYRFCVKMWCSYRNPINLIIFTLRIFNCNLRKHDSAKLHFGQVTTSLNMYLKIKWISRGGSHAWPPCSPGFVFTYSICGTTVTSCCSRWSHWPEMSHQGAPWMM